MRQLPQRLARPAAPSELLKRPAIVTRPTKQTRGREDITSLEMKCKEDGSTKIEVWAKCNSIEDCDDMIAWLQLAKSVIIKWNKINARTSQTPKAPTGKNENAQPR